jgi:hypothetical protein
MPITLIDKPGLYESIPHDEYLADPVIKPSLSSHIAKLLINKSPRHARHEHPRLNPSILDEVRRKTRPLDIGSAAHKLILGEGAAIDTIPFDAYTKKDAQQMRADSYKAGNIPILAPDMAKVETLVEAAKDQLADEGLSDLFSHGDPEVTMAWKERKDVWCRGRIDYLPDAARLGGHIRIPELKTTDGSAHPDDYQSTFFSLGYDYQGVFYERGLRELIKGIKSIEWVWCVLEQEPPHGLSVIRMSNLARDDADTLIETAIDMWDACMKTGKWRGYDSKIAPIDPAFWQQQRKEGKRLALQDRLRLWQAPLKEAS